MPLSDYFKYRDPYVQAGIISRPQNWQMRLGSLAAALGNMDRPGMLGQSLAQAGAIYQDQRAGALTAAIERAQEQAKAVREEELYRMKMEDREHELAERKRLSDERATTTQATFDSRKSLQWRLHQLGLDPSLADNEWAAKSAIDEAEMAARPQEVKAAGYSSVPESGRVFRTNPMTGQPELFEFGAAPIRSGAGSTDLAPDYVDALVGQYPQHEAIIRANPESFATQAAQSVFDVPGKGSDPRTELERYMKDVRSDDAFVAQWEQQWEAQNRVDPNSDVTPPPPPDDIVYAEAMRRKKFLDDRLKPPSSNYGFRPGTSGLESIRRSQPGAQATRDRVHHLQGGAKNVKVQGGEQVAGMVLASPKVSSPATGKMSAINATPKKTEAQAQGQVRLEDAVAKGKLVLPQQQAAVLDTVVRQMVAQGIDPEEIANWLDTQVRLVTGR